MNKEQIQIMHSYCIPDYLCEWQGLMIKEGDQWVLREMEDNVAGLIDRAAEVRGDGGRHVGTGRA